LFRRRHLRVTAFFILQIKSGEFRSFHLSFVLGPCRPLFSKPMSPTRLRVFLLFSAGYFVSYVFRGVNLGFAPLITHDLGLSAADLGLLTSLYFLGFAGAQLPAGVLLDHYGTRRVTAGTLLFAAAGI